MSPSNINPPSSSHPGANARELLRTNTPVATTNPSQKIFDARSLAGSRYESCDSDDSCDSDGKTPTLFNTPPRPPPASLGAAEQPPRCPSRPRGMVLRDWAMTKIPDKEILDVLTRNVKIGARTISIFEAAQPRLGSSAAQQPPYDLAVALHNSLSESNLSIEQKRNLFISLDWKFECLACGEVKKPDAFDKGFHLWGPAKDGPKPWLRSGPCRNCVNNMRTSKKPEALVNFDVCLPPECVNRGRPAEQKS
ncbi:unnamed protein product [Clonostachys rhizophaga]|uniref:Uncharacterized protein n=1 Tax=Clonostachys rhizophaga TaxID=160324 RepID=A0A9N9V3V6_9HYPO|nr:unnamed protein product [Clonostachys rhizophaga]